MRLEDLRRILSPLTRRVSTMVSRVVVRNVDDKPGRQELQVEGFAGELHERVEHFQPFGLRARPPIGSEAVGVAVGGSRNHVVVLGASSKDHGHDAELEEGEAMLYSTDQGVRVWAKKDGTLRARGRTNLTLELDGIEQKQFVRMLPGQTVFQVEKPDDPTKVSRITITPEAIVVETDSFIHP